MGQKDPRVDAYIAKAAEFAKPILSHLRKLVHAACPAAEETIKWGMPHFQYHGLFGHMAAFKAHCAFGLRRGQLVVGDNDGKAEQAMGHFGRITRLADLPADKVIAGYIKKAAQLAEAAAQESPRKKKVLSSRPPRPPLAAPDCLLAALRKNKKAQAAFNAFSPSHRREYIEWIADAKKEETRNRRLDTAIGWLAAGKSRNWKYEKR
jgi:uncharacterized protein YdeI (YjbR/CyaY-like superfamily)